jgi:hypothetical protein
MARPKNEPPEDDFAVELNRAAESESLHAAAAKRQIYEWPSMSETNKRSHKQMNTIPRAPHMPRTLSPHITHNLARVVITITIATRIDE